MADPPRTQSQAKAAPARAQERAADQAAARPAARSRAEPIALPQSATATTTKKGPGLQMEAAIVTEGHGGEKNIALEEYWVGLVDGHLPKGFNVRTREGHGLEVLMEQRSYRRTYSGTGALKTGLTPNAPIGTPGRIFVTDTTTGETLEQPWRWRVMGGWGSGWWRFNKRLFWKG